MVPWEGECDGLLPLMAVEQPTKGKVRPELYRELNKRVSCHTGDEAIGVCADKLREWRQNGVRNGEFTRGFGWWSSTRPKADESR